MGREIPAPGRSTYSERTVGRCRDDAGVCFARWRVIFALYIPPAARRVVRIKRAASDANNNYSDAYLRAIEVRECSHVLFGDWRRIPVLY